MRYNEQLPIKLYDKTFTLQAIIDDYAEISFSHNLYEAGDFSISINYNIPNAQLFQRGMFIQFGNDEYMFGEILSITDTIAQDGKGSQTRTITGKDARFLFKRRVIKNMNSEGSWVMTAKGELCMRNLIADQCGVNAEEKRRLPIINNIPSEADALGASYSVSESFSNLYDTLVTIATQSEIGWRVRFTGDLILEVYNGTDLSNNVQFSTDFDSLSNGTFTDTSESFANTVYVGGKGTGEDRDVYEGEIEGAEGLDRYEAFDNQSGMTTESEYETEALSILSQYGQTITVNGNGLAKCPYIFKEQYNIGDIITIAFSGKSAKAQILGVTEHWSFGTYGITFSFGKPVNDLNRQLQLILKQIQKASNKTTTTSSVKYYTIPTDTQMPKSDVIYDTIGFTGTVETGATFKLYLDNEKTGAKTYHIYFKQLAGAGKLTLTTGVTGASNLVMNAGTYVAIIYVDNLGNVTMAGATATNTVEAGNTQPVTSDGVNSAIQSATGGLVTGVKGNAEATYRTGDVNITKANIGLGNVDNTSDMNKPVSTAQATAINDAINAVTDILSSLPTDAVLHYSFDEVPDYPDGTAVYKKDNDWVNADNWNSDNNNTTFSVSNGIAKWTATDTNTVQLARAITGASGKIFRIKFRCSVKNINVTFLGQYSSSFYVLTSITYNTDWAELVGFIPSNYTNYLVLQFNTATIGATVEISQFYIGDGSYSTPIIDNASGQNNATNNGGIATKGVSGKGIYFLQSSNAYINAYNKPLDGLGSWTLSFWLNLNRGVEATSKNPRLYQFGYLDYCFCDGFYVGRNVTSFNFATYKDNSHKIFATVNMSQYIGQTIFVTVETEIDTESTSTKRVYINGLLKAQATGSIIEKPTYSSWSIGGNTGNQHLENTMIDDFQIFSRALTEKEVLALYYNKANTPKYYTKADYLLEQIANNS